MWGESMSKDDNNIVYLVPPGQLRCYVTGQLRKDTPEENVRQRWARSLVEEYGYPKADLGIEVTIAMGRSRKHADLVIFGHDARHVQGEALIIIEAKRSDKKPSDAKDGHDQLISYMAASPVCRFGLWVGQERLAFERDSETGEIHRVGDIPRFGSDEPERPMRADLVPAHELKSVFRRCHNYIYANAGLQKAEAFHELLKLIFCKIFDEEEGGDVLTFSVHPKERTSESGQRRLMEDQLNPLFERIVERYPFIFDEGERIALDPRVAAYVVHELQYLSLLDTATDVMGDAYEELVGENLRGDRGEYFTPRNVCDMAVRMIMSLHPESKLTSLKVLDICCGTGGFLVSWLNNLHELIVRQEESRPAGRRVLPRERARRRLRDACNLNLFGIDINPFLVRTCQMNLVVHGDGSSNVFRADSVRTPGEWPDEPRRRVPYGKADVVFTNPPFGGKASIDDSHVLDQYELPKWESVESRALLPAEQLFVEAALKFVKPGGYLAIVLPDGILNNPSLRFIRSWLLSRTRIIASVDLPKTTFKASGGVNNPSMLIVQKSTRKEAPPPVGVIDEAYQVFMASPQTAGINNRAVPIYLRHPDGREQVDEEGQKIRDDQIRAVPDAFLDWVKLRR